MTARSRSRSRRFKLWLSSWAAYLLVRLFGATFRFRIFGAANREQAMAQHPTGAFCLGLWHEHLFGAIYGLRGQQFAPLASLSRDGDLATFVLERFGYRTVRGSSSRRGPEARDDLVTALAEGWFTAITMDGPRGPRRQAKSGILDIARRGGVAVLPLIVMADRQWVLGRSWDRFKIPRPFARIGIHYGVPFLVPADSHGAVFGEYKARLRQAMAATEAEAARAMSDWCATPMPVDGDHAR